LDIPVEVRPHVCAPFAARLAHKLRLDVRQPQIIGPVIGHQRDRVAATRIPRTPLSRISAKVIFTGRSTIAHDSGLHADLQYNQP
jgi:hypothetical protein